VPEVLDSQTDMNVFDFLPKTGQAKKIPGELDVGHFRRTLGEFDVGLGA